MQRSRTRAGLLERAMRTVILGGGAHSYGVDVTLIPVP